MSSWPCSGIRSSGGSRSGRRRSRTRAGRSRPIGMGSCRTSSSRARCGRSSPIRHVLGTTVERLRPVRRAGEPGVPGDLGEPPVDHVGGLAERPRSRLMRRMRSAPNGSLDADGGTRGSGQDAGRGVQVGLAVGRHDGLAVDGRDPVPTGTRFRGRAGGLPAPARDGPADGQRRVRRERHLDSGGVEVPARMLMPLQAGTMVVGVLAAVTLGTAIDSAPRSATTAARLARAGDGGRTSDTNLRPRSDGRATPPKVP